MSDVRSNKPPVSIPNQFEYEPATMRTSENHLLITLDDLYEDNSVYSGKDSSVGPLCDRCYGIKIALSPAERALACR